MNNPIRKWEKDMNKRAYISPKRIFRWQKANENLLSTICH